MTTCHSHIACEESSKAISLSCALRKFSVQKRLGCPRLTINITRRREVRSLWLTGRAGVTVAEAARAMVDEARQMLQKDLGIHIDWASSQERESSLVAAASINRELCSILC